MESTENTQVQVLPVNKAKVRKLLRIAIILGIITSIEFFLAVGMPRGILLYAVFVGLTLVKAFYIVSEFMHLRHEVKILIWTILIPFVLVVWLLLALSIEGESVLHLKIF
jgi:cytochrome c oxidase subunit IV